MWFPWECPPQSQICERLGSSWWRTLGRCRRCLLAGGSMLLGHILRAKTSIHFPFSLLCASSSGCEFSASCSSRHGCCLLLCLFTWVDSYPSATVTPKYTISSKVSWLWYFYHSNKTVTDIGHHFAHTLLFSSLLFSSLLFSSLLFSSLFLSPHTHIYPLSVISFFLFPLSPFFPPFPAA